jgi:hypothetical protein
VKAIYERREGDLQRQLLVGQSFFNRKERKAGAKIAIIK